MRCVKRVYTDLAVVDVTPAGLVVRDILDGLTHERAAEANGRAAYFLRPIAGCWRRRPCRTCNSVRAGSILAWESPRGTDVHALPA